MSDDLRAQRDRFLALAFANADLLVELDAEARIGFAAGAARRFLGCEAEDLVGCTLDEIVAPDDMATLRAAIRRLVPGQRFATLSVRLRRADAADQDAGERGIQVIAGGSRMPPHEDRVYLAFAEAQPDLSDGRDHDRDSAAGLLEIDDFAQRASEAVNHARRLEQHVKMTLLELPGLQGTEIRAGDDPLKAFMRELGGYLRSISVGDASGRLGPEKFGVLHAMALSSGEICREVTRIAEESAPFLPGLEPLATTVDIEPDLDEEDTGRALVFTINRFARAAAGQFSMESLNDAASHMMDRALSRIGAFKAAIRDKNVKLVCQPIVHLQTGEVKHYELLSRFAQEQDTFDLVTFAEDVGIIQELDLAIVESALDLLTRFLPRPAGSGEAPVSLAVNVSGHSLKSHIFVQMLLTLLRAHRGQADRLIFEVTESSTIDDLDGINKVLQQVRSLGHEVCLDDFGAGASSLHYLNAFEVDFIKIDGAYVRGLVRGDRESKMLRAMASLARTLNIATVAEMIETEEELAALREVGVDYGQGYLLGRPEPVSRLVRRVAQHRLRRGRTASAGDHSRDPVDHVLDR